MIRIFAKLNTTEKAVVVVQRGSIHAAQTKLNDEHGGSWVLVDELIPHQEIIIFNDNTIYKGFSPNINRYTDAIKSFKP
jgi:hypothetical protein